MRFETNPMHCVYSKTVLWCILWPLLIAIDVKSKYSARIFHKLFIRILTQASRGWPIFKTHTFRLIAKSHHWHTWTVKVFSQKTFYKFLATVAFFLAPSDSYNVQYHKYNFIHKRLYCMKLHKEIWHLIRNRTYF